jgi:hypothetical protein
MNETLAIILLVAFPIVIGITYYQKRQAKLFQLCQTCDIKSQHQSIDSFPIYRERVWKNIHKTGALAERYQIASFIFEDDVETPSNSCLSVS